MKPIIYLSFLLAATSTHSQIQWLAPGAKWTYEYESFLGRGKHILEVLDQDTILNGQNIKTLQGTTILSIYEGGSYHLDTLVDIFHAFTVNQQVFMSSDFIQQYVLMYDLNKVVGDTLGIVFGGWSPEVFMVTETGIMEWNDIEIQYQDIAYPSFFQQGEWDTFRVLEGIGSTPNHFYHYNTIIQPFDFPTFYLRCYEDAEHGVFNFSEQGLECDDFPELTSTTDEQELAFKIFPNPASDVMTLELPGEVKAIHVYDMLGKLRIITWSHFQRRMEIDLHELESGVYFLHAMDAMGKVKFIQKVIKG